MIEFQTNGVFVCFDGNRLMHMNAPHTGERYAIVLFNPDFSYHDGYLRHAHERTEVLRHADIAPPHVIARVTTDHQRHLQQELVQKLKHTQKWVSRVGRSHAKYGNRASHTLTFGHVRSRSAFNKKDKIQECSANRTHSQLYLALKQYMHACIGDGADEYATVFVAKNSMCDWHTDKSNVGPSISTAVGSYDGGELCIRTDTVKLQPCGKCKSGHKCRRLFREVFKHTAPEWFKKKKRKRTYERKQPKLIAHNSNNNNKPHTQCRQLLT